MRRLMRALTREDVGKPWIRIGNQVYMCSDFIGRVFPGDIGKLLYDCGDGVIQVENDDQRAARLAPQVPHA